MVSIEYDVVSSTKGPHGEEVSIQTTNQTHTAVENLKPESRFEHIPCSVSWTSWIKLIVITTHCTLTQRSKDVFEMADLKWGHHLVPSWSCFHREALKVPIIFVTITYINDNNWLSDDQHSIGSELLTPFFSCSYEFKVVPKNELGSGPTSDPVSFSTESGKRRRNVKGLRHEFIENMLWALELKPQSFLRSLWNHLAHPLNLSSICSRSVTEPIVSTREASMIFTFRVTLYHNKKQWHVKF